ncbi:MAG: DNA-processing protein DprA [Planctomycetota bacterium]
MNLAQLSGPAIRRLSSLERFPECLCEKPSQVARAAGLRARTARRLEELHRRRAPRREVERATRLGAQLLTLATSGYPDELRPIPDPPLVLYRLGGLEPAGALRVAIVGARGCTCYGWDQAYRLGQALAASGVTVVSGLARGIDQAAHEGALSAAGFVIAVLGCGIDRVYPPEAASLYSRVARHGALVSEFPLGTPPRRHNFPRRNRVLSGLARVVVVVEATSRSGSLITVRHALEQGREVMAVPGPVDSRLSEGTNRLIRDGAAPLLAPCDLLEALGFQPLRAGLPLDQRAPAGLSDSALTVLRSLEASDLGCDALCESTGLALEEVMEAIVVLQARGLVGEVPGARYTRRVASPPAGSQTSAEDQSQRVNS